MSEGRPDAGAELDLHADVGQGALEGGQLRDEHHRPGLLAHVTEADELTAEEYREGGRLLAVKAARFRPRWLAVVGVTAYRAAFGERGARVGPQERTFGGTRVWVLPNPSGLNAHWTAATMAEEFGRLRAVAGPEGGPV